jgi:hypothetical protein
MSATCPASLHHRSETIRPSRLVGDVWLYYLMLGLNNGIDQFALSRCQKTSKPKQYFGICECSGGDDTHALFS